MMCRGAGRGSKVADGAERCEEQEATAKANDETRTEMLAAYKTEAIDSLNGASFAREGSGVLWGP